MPHKQAPARMRTRRCESTQTISENLGLFVILLNLACDRVHGHDGRCLRSGEHSVSRCRDHLVRTLVLSFTMSVNTMALFADGNFGMAVLTAILMRSPKPRSNP